MATPQSLNRQNISNVSSIYSSTGKLIVTLSVNGKLVEAICSEIVNSQFVEIGGLLNSHHVFRELNFFTISQIKIWFFVRKRRLLEGYTIIKYSGRYKL